MSGEQRSGWLRVAEVGRELSLPRSSVLDLIRRGDLAAARVGHLDARRPTYRVSRAEVDRFIAERSAVVAASVADRAERPRRGGRR